MKYIKGKNQIKILSPQEFNIKQILDCGQIFRYVINDDIAIVYSKDKRATIKTEKDQIIILSDDINYFENFFDLKIDYEAIKNKLKTDKFLVSAIEYGYGIRILNNDLFEMIVSFIISANNNISRIKKSIEYLCSHFGSNMGEYFAFPTLDQLKSATVDDFKLAGLGYRSEYMFETIQRLTHKDIDTIITQNKQEQFDFLVTLKGVGEKVANCILLFGLSRKDVFPVDTWINKVYNKLNNSNETNRKRITQELTNRYGNLSGYAQQYFFYYFRENKVK